MVSSLPLLLGFLLKHLNPAEYGLIQGHKEDLELTYKEILFFASLAIAFFLISLSLRHIRRQAVKRLVAGFAVAYVCAALLIILTDVVYYLIFAYRITFSAIQTMLNTNPEEVKGFIKLYYSPGCIVAILAFIAVALLLFFKRARFTALFASRSFFMISLLATVFGIVDFGQMAHSKGNGPHNVRYWDIIIGEYNEYREFNRRLALEKNNLNLSKAYDGFYKGDTLTKTLVVVVSESLSKRHMSVYGYPRKTTPGLDTARNIFVFNDCVTQAALTISAVPALFFNGYLSQQINLIALLNKLGYETSWISNQSGWGKGDRSIVLLAQVCKNTVFTDAMADNDKANASLHYDEEVLDRFDRALGATSGHSKFIVVHLMGCHFDYEKRYPANRNLFTSAAPAKMAVKGERIQTIVNTYDNAMHYHDSVVNEILNIFAKRSAGKNAALVFLSDHGEELYDNRDYAGHGYPPSRVTSEIPYFTSLSPGFKKHYPAIETYMKQRLNTPYSTAGNFYTLLHLLDIRSKKYRSKILKNAFFSPFYDSTATRMVMGHNYDQMPF